MTKSVRYLFLFALLHIAGVFNTAHALTIVDSKMSGSWFDPTHDGEGFVVEVLADGRAVVYWFTYDTDGNQRWFIGTGNTQGDTAVFDDLLVTSGPVFGDRYQPEDLVYTTVGNLSIQWIDCSTATATYNIDGTAGRQDLRRLTTIAGLDCEPPVSVASPMTGSWFDVTHDGEGLVIEILRDGRALVYWFSYDSEGKQVWFFGPGEQDGAVISISEMYITNGGRFGESFDPEQVNLEPWGNLQVELDCRFGKFDYASGLPAFGSGKQTLTRLTSLGNPVCEPAKSPNILLVIADDLGLDASSQYDISAQQPNTPTLDQLAAEGLVFESAWSNPTCSPTRAGILTGKFGTRTGVLTAGDVLSTNETSLQSFIHEHLPGKYVDAVIGKWHLGPRPGGQNHPADMGIGYFAGITGGGVDDYEDWPLTINGQRSNETQYVTSKLVDLAVDWTGEQDKPWLLWLAFNAPHTPFHLPPSDLHDRQLPGTEDDISANPLPYYFAAIEAMDTEIGRLLDSFDPETKDNTIIIFIGDNGTPARVAQFPYSRNKAKGSLFQGGINVPLFVSGAGVTRTGEREHSLINSLDLFSTIAALAGVNVEQVNDSVSFEGMLSEDNQPGRFAQYSEQSTETGKEWAISDGIYKLMESDSGTQQLYHLALDPFESTDLISTGAAPASVVEDLEYLAGRMTEDTSTPASTSSTDGVL